MLAAGGLASAGLLGLAVRTGAEWTAAPAPESAVGRQEPSDQPGSSPAPPAHAPSSPESASETSRPGRPDSNAERTSEATPAPRLVAAGSGRLHVVPGNTPRSGSGPLRRYRVEVESGLGLDGQEFTAEVDRVLTDPRSWGADDRLSFQRVSHGPVAFRVVLASPTTTDRLCGPFASHGRYSCGIAPRNASGPLVTGAVINSRRWLRGAETYAGQLPQYREYLINHEVGHALDHRHKNCSGAGRPAPVMMQQTKGVGACRPNSWPFP